MISQDVLDRLRPMHLRLDADGRCCHAGPTLSKILAPDRTARAHFRQLLKPAGHCALDTMDDLRRTRGRRIRLRLCGPPGTGLVGHFVPTERGGGILDLSFGISVANAVRDHPLTSADFAPTDLTVEFLFLVESKSAAMESALQLNQRLHDARLAAEEQALTDTLTGLRNRRAVDSLINGMEANGGSFAAMLIDLDRFKAVNDTFGHAAGDRVLQHVAEVLVGDMRRGDVAARVGGDEFLLVLPDPPDPRHLRTVAERLIARIEAPIDFRGISLNVSASIGLAWHAGGSQTPAFCVLDAADRALYTAKRSGRGRVAFKPDAA